MSRLVLSLAVLFSLTAPDDPLEDTRRAIVDEINTVRRSAGVRPLRLVGPLSSVAQKRAEEIVGRDEIHSLPAQEDTRRAKEAGYEPRLVAEIAATADGDVESVVSAWREAQGVPARELVGADYREVGVGLSLKSETPLYVVLFALSWGDYFRDQTGALSDLERVRWDMLARVNRERTSRGLTPLRRQPYLDDAAQGHADDMFARRYYSHDSLEHKTAMDRVTAKGYRARYVGENIARGQYSVDEVMDGWMESPSHREHLLSPIFNDVGFGLKFGKDPGGYEILWVQNFARPRGRERL